MIRELSIKNISIVFLTQIIPWVVLFYVGMVKPLGIEAIGPFLNNKPAAIIISVSLAFIITFTMFVAYLINRIAFHKVNASEIKLNIVVSSIHIIGVFVTIIALYGGEDL